jgi:hypothetical protein
VTVRRNARFLWSKVGAKLIDEETLEWLSGVAWKILDADRLSGSKRKDAIVAATDLRGSANAPRATLLFVLHILCEEQAKRPGELNTAKAARTFVADLMGWHNIAADSIDKNVDRAIDEEIDDPNLQAKYRACLHRRRPKKVP